MIEFGEYLPDLPDLGNPGATEAKNVIPHGKGYLPLKSCSRESTSALTKRAIGGVGVSLSDGNNKVYATDEDAIYTLVSSEWANVSKGLVDTGGLVFKNASGAISASGSDFTIFNDGETISITGTVSNDGTYTVNGDPTTLTLVVSESLTDETITGTVLMQIQYATSDDVWDFALYGDRIVATNNDDYPQTLDPTSASVYNDLTTSLRGKTVATVRTHLVFGNTWDAVDGNQPDRVRWSADGDPTDFTVSAVTGSDYQNLYTGGPIQRIFGGEYGVVVCQRSIWRMEYVGSPTFFQFDETLPGIGTLYPSSWAQYGDIVIGLGVDGFYQIVNGSQAVSIGKNKIDREVLGEITTDYRQYVKGAIDPINRLYFLIYPTTGSSCDRGVIYDFVNGRWSRFEDDLHWLFPAVSAGNTLDDALFQSLNLDTMSPSLDSPVWQGGRLYFGLFDDSNYLASFSGSNMAATIETGEVQFTPDRRSLLRSAKPLVDGGTVTVQAGARDLQTASRTWTGAVSPNSRTGKAMFRSLAYYHMLRANLTGDWTHATGMDIEAYPRGKK